MRAYWLGAFFALLLGPSTYADTQDAGYAIYHAGQLPTGEPLTARLQGGTLIRGNQFSCVRCHKRSALGTSEAGLVVPPLTAERLFSPRVLERKELYGRRSEGQKTTRPAYDRAALARAIRDGIDPAGRPLHPAMPRYALDDQSIAAISRYLEQLHETTAPGVTDTDIHFATIITPDVPARERAALQKMQEQFVAEKNANTRYEPNRVKHPPWHKEWHYQHWRRWNLHLWELEGDPASWREQLVNLYQQQPVFAVIGGASYQDWQPVHHFCEQSQVPCLFPSLRQAPTQIGLYSLYFSPGLTLEARALALSVRKNMDTPQGVKSVIQWIGNAPGARQAAKAFKQALSDLPISVEERKLSDPVSQDTTDMTVAWLTAEELTQVPYTTHQSDKLVFSSTLLEQQFERIPASVKSRAVVLHPYMAPQNAKRMLRSKVWLRSRALPLVHERIQSDNYFALTLMGDALMHIRSHFNRDYLIERVEHMTENMLEPSLYPHLSLGPGQRFGAKGCYVVPLSELRGKRQIAEHYWLIP